MTTDELAAAGPSIAVGEPIETVEKWIAGPRVDDILRGAAERAPDRIALRDGDAAIGYADLDRRVTRCAEVLGGLVGQGAVVGVAAVPTADFPVAFYGTSRSGNVSAILNPLWHAGGLEHALRTSGARACVVTPKMYERLASVRDRLPLLETVVLTERGPATGDVPVLGEAAAGAGAAAAPAAGPEDVACILFTSGTTGAPKAVQLTHRNLTVNAAQMVRAHELTEDSVMLNCLPLFHLMHLNGGVCATATHVLFPADDHRGSLEVAARYGATHYYSLPVRLARLAADPDLPDTAVPTLRAILSGGSALPVRSADALARRFGVPAVQGFGLAETSPLTHGDRLDAPAPGSCGRPLAGTECRIVHVDDRTVLPAGQNGEVEVRGPQLMRGYLGSPPLEPGAWFATGDVGHLDGDGRLHLVDRIKDVFKHDNHLVSPTEIETVLRGHPAVADCVVVDRADEFRGAVACALVVSGDSTVDPVEFAEFVNARVPYYQRLWRVEEVDAIPRSVNGKVQRAALREQVGRWSLPGRPPGRQLEGENGW